MGRRFDVNREASAEPVCFLDELVLGAGHYFHVDVAFEAVLVAYRVHDLEQPFGGLGTAAGDAGAEEEAVDRVASAHFHEGVGELIDLEGVALSGDPVAVGAVEAVHLAEVGEHDAHEADELPVWHCCLIDAGNGIAARGCVGRGGSAAGGGA